MKHPRSVKDGANEFSVCKLDPDTPEELSVETYSNLFGKVGAVVIVTNVTSTDLASINIERHGPVEEECQYLQDLIDEWNQRPRDNWAAMVNEARASVTGHYQRQVDEGTEKLAKAMRGEF